MFQDENISKTYGKDYNSELIIWDMALLNVVDVKHGLLIKRQITKLFENSIMLFVLGKSGTIQIEDTPHILNLNCLFHISGNKQIVIDSHKDEIEYFIIAYQAEIPPNAGREMLSAFMKNSPFDSCFSMRTTNTTSFEDKFLEMVDTYRHKTPLNRLSLKRLFYSIIYEFYKERMTSQYSPVKIDVCKKAKQYLQENFCQINSIQFLANSLGVKRNTLHEQFKRNIGISPQQYVMQLRLDSACTALADDKMSITEIASCCGFQDESYFSRVFKQKYGIPPGAYRKNLSESEKLNGRKALKSVIVPTNKDYYAIIENFGRFHRYYGIPRRIVCLNYSAAEVCAALGMADRLTGVASAEGSIVDCAEQYRQTISAAPFLTGRSLDSNIPDFQTVYNCKPDIVIGTSYSFRANSGVADAEDFERLGIHIYALKATYTLDSTFEDTYEDIRNLGIILGVNTCAEELVENMKAQEVYLLNKKTKAKHPVRVFSFDSVSNDKAFTCGQSLESHMIKTAGGINIFEEEKRQFTLVDWVKVAAKNPQAIIIHRFYDKGDGERKLAFLRRVAEIADTDAIRNNKILVLGIKKIFPSIDNIETTMELARWLSEI